MVDESGNDYGCSGKVLLNQALVIIHIRVMGHGKILNRILNKLKTRQPNPVEGDVIGRPGISITNCVCVPFCKRLQPRSEEGSQGFVFLQIDSANLSGTVIDIVVSREVIVLFKLFYIIDCTPARTGFGKKVVHIFSSSVQTLFFTGPERYTDGSAGLNVERDRKSTRLNSSHSGES